jgi:ABC-type uncharacterized transport system substrate-binding protein
MRRREFLKNLGGVAAAIPVAAYAQSATAPAHRISYGPNLDTVYRRAAHFVDKIIKGERVSDLPVEQLVTFDLVINQRTAKALGINMAHPVWSAPTRRSNNVAQNKWCLSS